MSDIMPKKRRLSKPLLRLLESLENQSAATHPTKMLHEKQSHSFSKSHSATPAQVSDSEEEVPAPRKRIAEKPVRKWVKRDMPADRKPL